MFIGILKEKNPETRVALIPEAVKTLTGLKAGILAEYGSGAKAFMADQEYEKEGARMAKREDVLSGSDCIVTIDALNPEELATWGPGKILVGHLNPYQNKPFLDALAEHRITSFSLDLLPRTSLAQSMDILSSMATVSGYKAVIQAADHLPRFFPMLMTAAGTIKPARVLILGAGVAGLQALATARRLGAVVEVFDVRSAVKEEVHSLGGRFIEVEGSVENQAAGGYAVEQLEEYKQKQQELIHRHALKADAVICTALIPGKKAPLLIHKETVESMVPGSVIVDLAAANGGNCALSVNNQIIRHKDITIIGNSAYPASLPFDASRMVSNNIVNFVKLMLDASGNILPNREHEILKKTCLTLDGRILHDSILTYYNTH